MTRLQEAVQVKRTHARDAGDFNLRDTFRWCELMEKYQGPGHWDPSVFLETLFLCRLRRSADRAFLLRLYEETVGAASQAGAKACPPRLRVQPSHLEMGRVLLPRGQRPQPGTVLGHEALLPHTLALLEHVGEALSMGWMVNLVGPSSCGKTSLVRSLAKVGWGG